jgi:hypothetical protein
MLKALLRLLGVDDEHRHSEQLKSDFKQEVRDYVDEKFRTAREQIDDELRRIAWRKWMPLSLLAWGIAIAMFIYNVTDFFELKHKVRDQVNEQVWASVTNYMTQPNIETNVQLILKSRTAEHVDKLITPLSNRVDRLNAEITEKQAQLAKDQEFLRNQVEVQRLSLAAKGGDLNAYRTLHQLATNDSPNGIIAKAAITEILIYAEQYKNKPKYVKFVLLPSNEPIPAVDEVVYSLTTEESPWLILLC